MFVKPFKQISKTDTLIAGGKGASLGEMTQAKIPVPEGFVILSNAFNKFIEDTDLNIEIDAVLDEVDIREIHTVENASKKIQAVILSKEMPEDIKAEILGFYKKLNCKFVAVRSSATSEDSASAAWAGQLESYLNTTEEMLLRNVKNCWASLFSPRAIFYRFERGLNKDKISVAVVVQKMINSEESGIAFSVHPVTQDENQIIIEAGFGLGEAIVSGSITPDSYVVDKQRFSIIDVNINEQTKALYKKDKGGNEWRELGEKGKKQVLTEKEIIELSKLIVKIENHYNFPCDIEWAKENGKFYITQSRPITTIEKKSIANETINRFKDYFKDKEITKQEGSFSPLVWGTAASSIEIPLYRKYYPKIDFGPLIFMNKENKGAGFFNFNSYLACAEEGLRKYLSGELEEFNDMKNLSERITKMYNNYPPSFLLNLKDKELINIIKETFLRLQEAQIITLFCEALDENIVKKYFKNFNKSENIHLEEFFNVASLVYFNSFFGQLDSALIEFDKKNPYKVQWAFSDYMGTPKIEDIPHKVKELIKEKGGIDKIREEREKLEKEISENKEKTSKFKAKLSSDLKMLFEFTQETIKLRDLRKRDFFNCLVLLSNSVRELLKRKKINENLFNYVISSDLKKELYLKENYGKILEKRKEGNLYYFDEKYFQELNVDYEKIKKEIFDFIDRGIGEEIKGTIAQRGFVQGKARIILNQSQFKEFKEGDVLITSMTRPEFVPLMKKAKAIITDEGGLTCHATIISRELKKPCIVGTKNASRLIKNDDLIQIDANNGTITILNKNGKK